MRALPPLREVIERHGLWARKALGQNFLLDMNLVRRIARAAGPLEGARVYEVGPGPGGLTRALLEEGAQVTAVEKDERCLAALEELALAFPGKLTVTQGDALALPPPLEPPYRIVANLPYNIGTPLLISWLTAPWPPPWTSLTLMFQKEVAQRIAAKPGQEAYGRLAVLAQWRGEAKLLFDVPPRAFTPPPKVTSAIVQITPKPPLLELKPAMLERVTAAAFGQRRKMLRSALKSLTPDPEALLQAANLDPTRRAETLSVLEFCQLTQAFVASI